MRSHYVDQPRIGDHICYISNLSHAEQSLPGWGITKTLDDIFSEIIVSWERRLSESQA